MINLLGVLVILLLFSILFIFSGRSLLTDLIPKNRNITSLFISTSYFFGMSIFLSIWRTLSFLTNNAIFSLISTLICLIILTYYFGKETLKSFSFEFLSLIKSKWFLLISFFIFFYVILFWLLPLKSLDPYSSIGTLHSLRYTNFANYILEFNQIPVLGQNYGQSMLSAIPIIFGFNSPLLALNLWLSITIINFILLIFSMCKYMDFNVKFSILSTFLILFGNTSFSFLHILTIDSGSPFILNGYTDSISSIGTFVVALFFLNEKIFKNLNSQRVTLKEIIIIFSFSVFWNISSPQNSIFFGLLIVLLFFLKIQINKVILFKVLFYFLVFSFIGVKEGGMYTPSKFKDKIEIPGMKEINKKGISISPGIPFFVDIKGTWEFGNKYLNHQGVEIRKQIKNSGFKFKLVPQIIYLLEQYIVNSIKVIFWPLSGIIGLFILLKFNFIKMGNNFSNQFESKHKKIIFSSLFLFLIGILFNLFVSISGYKWELSRFLILGYFFGMFCLVICFNFLRRNYIIPKRVIYFLVFFITFGPVSNSFVIITRNVFYTENGISFFDKIVLLINTSGIIK